MNPSETTPIGGGMLTARDLSVRIAGQSILRDVSFVVRKGESVTIIGPNGAGKTTLLKCLGGLMRPTEGDVLLEGRSLRLCARRETAMRIAYVPQSAGHMLPCTAHDFILMARYAHFRRLGGIGAEDKAAAHRAMALTETEQFWDRPLRTLSGGQRQKVLVAAALAQEAPILLLDEPATFLDYRHEADILGLIERLHREDARTILTVSHDLNKGALDSDRVLALSRGRVSFVGSPHDFVSSGMLEAVFDTRFDIVEHPHSGRTLVVPAKKRP